VATKDRPAPPRSLTIRISQRQGRRFADGGAVKPVAIVTNLPDPEGGSGRDLIRGQRGKAWPPGWGTGPQPRSGGQAVEHAHHVLTNELAAEALPSQKFGANAAWFRLNVLLHNLLSAFKRVALPPAPVWRSPPARRFAPPPERPPCQSPGPRSQAQGDDSPKIAPVVAGFPTTTAHRNARALNQT
jgi:hypothetical protein